MLKGMSFRSQFSRMRVKYITIILLFVLTNSSAQYFLKSTEWKKYRKEIYLGIGGANFLGDLGGLDRIGTDYSPADLEFALTQISAGAGYKYKLQKWLNVCIGFNYLKVKGDDKLTKDIYRNNRNLNFKSNIFEILGRVELVYMHNKVGNRYGIKKTFNRRMKTASYDLSAFFGIGGFYFNPKGRDETGKWHKLKPLHTEGQGLPGAPKQYRNYSICIPLGVSYRYYIERTWVVGLELTWRKTFTDYIDDVSTVYYDKAALLANYGSLAVKMADPNLGKIDGATSPDASGKGAQRGDNELDSYMSFQLTVGYIIKEKKHKKVKRSKLRRKF